MKQILRRRYWRIMRFAARYMIKVWWFDIVLPRIGLRKLSERGRQARFIGIARAFRELAGDLGGLMIKVGQFMSTRMDVLPAEITDELASLQDEVSPVSFPEIRTLIESEFGTDISDVFADVDPTPVASASLGQVHRATLQPLDADNTGLDKVMVKVLRPGIADIVETDLSALRRIARWLSHVKFIARRTDVPAVVGEFARTCYEEIDYRHEALNAHRFRENFADNPRLKAPQIVWERSTGRVLTLEDVGAIKISDVEALRAAGVDPEAVASEFARAMLEQYFVHGFFHADPHPGNLYVSRDHDWRLTFIDFGMMGAIPDSLRNDLRDLLIAVTAQDGRAMVASMQSMGVLLPNADIATLQHAMTQLFRRFGGIEMTELQNVDPREFEEFAEEFGGVMREMPFQLPENFLLLFRSVSLMSGVCSTLDPDFDLWGAAKPYIADLARAQSGDIAQEITRQASEVLRTVAGLPGKVDRLAEAAENGEIAVRSPRTERELARIERGMRRIVAAVLFAAMFVGGILLRWTDPAWGAVLMGVSAIPFLLVITGTRRRRFRHHRR